MKILQLCNKPPYPPKDGGCIAMNNLTEGLLSLGHEVKVLAINTPKHSTEEFPADYQEKTKVETVFIDTSVKPVAAFLNLFSQQSYNVQRFYSKAFEEKLVEILKSDTFDIIQLESIFVAPYLTSIRKHTQAKVILRSHNVEYEIWEKLAAQSSSVLKKLYLQLLAKRLKSYELSALKQFDGIACITNNDLEHFQQQSIKVPMQLIPFGIDLKKYQSTTLPKAKSFFHLGSMDWQPNIEGVQWFLDKVWPSVSKEHPDATLHLAGRGMPKEIYGYANDRIHIEGEITDALGYMKDYESMIVPLFSGSGMRVKLIEGLALGKNVISTHLGMQGIAGKNGEHYTLADTANEFIQAMQNSLSKDELAQQYGKAGQALMAAHYDNLKICENLVQFYQALMK